MAVRRPRLRWVAAASCAGNSCKGRKAPFSSFPLSSSPAICNKSNIQQIISATTQPPPFSSLPSTSKQFSPDNGKNPCREQLLQQGDPKAKRSSTSSNSWFLLLQLRNNVLSPAISSFYRGCGSGATTMRARVAAFGQHFNGVVFFSDIDSVANADLNHDTWLDREKDLLNERGRSGSDFFFTVVTCNTKPSLFKKKMGRKARHLTHLPELGRKNFSEKINSKIKMLD